MPEIEILIRDIQWILAGKTPTPEKSSDKAATVDIELLWKIILRVEEGLSRKGMTLDPAKKARLISILYESSLNTGKGARKKVVDCYLDLLS